MAKVRYVRARSVGQCPNVLLEIWADCDKLFQDRRSGTTNARAQIKQCLDYVRDGDQRRWEYLCV